jgi:hypothetical protein
MQRVGRVVGRRSSSFRAASSSSTFAAWTQAFNATADRQPGTTLATFLLYRNLSWYSLAAAFSLTPGLDVLSALGVGFLLARVTGKFRQPANIALAAALAKMFPALTLVKSGPLLGVVAKPDPLVGHPPPRQSRLQAFLEYAVVGPVDTYGFALFVAGKLNVLATVVLGGLAVHQGADVSALLSSLGVPDAVQVGGAAMGAATATNSLLLPLHLYVLPAASDAAAGLVQRTRKSTGG